MSVLTSCSKAQDPDIRRIAEEAETRLVRDPYAGYAPWPSPPPSSTGPPALASVHRQAPPDPNIHPAFLTPSPSTAVEQAVPPSPRDLSTPPSATGGPTTYASPYAPQPATNDAPTQPLEQPPVGQTTPPTDVPLNHSNGGPSPPQFRPITCDPVFAPPLRPASPQKAILSRTRETKILLSIDGDGIRGLSALLLVESLVNAICVKVGQRLDSHQIFDLTGGSSLGGVIAIMLCRLRMQAHRAREAYKQIAKQVFRNKRDYFKYLDPHAHGRTVDDTALENEIKDVVQQELGNPDAILLDVRTDSGDV